MYQCSLQRSGSGQALALFNKRVLPVLRESGVDYEVVVTCTVLYSTVLYCTVQVVVTTRQNHARDLVASQDVWRWRAIVIGEGSAADISV